MEAFYKKEINKLEAYTWKMKYDNQTNTATFVNEKGEEMDFITFGVCLEALQNTRYDMHKKVYGETNKEPLDELTRKRFGVRDYKLIRDEERGEDKREVFEVYSDDNRIFTLENYKIDRSRKKYNGGFLVYLNQFEAEEVFESLEAFVDRVRKR